MENMRIDVSATAEDLGTPESLCAYRHGLPSYAHSNPEIFNCSKPMVGRFIQVSLVNSTIDHFMCYAEMQIFGQLGKK